MISEESREKDIAIALMFIGFEYAWRSRPVRVSHTLIDFGPQVASMVPS